MRILLNTEFSLDALAARLSDSEGTLQFCDSVVDVFVSGSTEDHNKALDWSDVQQNGLILSKQTVTKENTSALLQMVYKHNSATWLTEK